MCSPFNIFSFRCLILKLAWLADKSTREKAFSFHIPIPNQIQGHHRRYNFVLPVQHLTEGVQHAPVRFATGRFHFVYGYAQGESIARAHRLKPAQFIHSRASQTGWAGQIVFNKQPHEQAAGVPTAGDDTAVNCFSGPLRICVIWYS